MKQPIDIIKDIIGHNNKIISKRRCSECNMNYEKRDNVWYCPNCNRELDLRR